MEKDILAALYARNQDLSIRERVDLILQVCDALAYLHRQPVVHRDLKLSDVLVTSPENRVKLLDSGIAKCLYAAARVLTETGTSPLTWQYASPEQAEAGPITVLTDVHAGTINGQQVVA